MSRPRPPFPPKTLMVSYGAAMAGVEATAVLIRCEDEAATIRDNERVGRLLEETTDRVIGNRSETNIITWDDLRYLLLARLKLLVDYLEGNLVDDAGPAGL